MGTRTQQIGVSAHFFRYFFRAFFELFGGGTRDRTADLLHAMQALSQLSYTPASKEGRIIESTLWVVNPFHC